MRRAAAFLALAALLHACGTPDAIGLPPPPPPPPAPPPPPPPAPVATVTVSGLPATMLEGDLTVRLTAVTKDAEGNILGGRLVTWSTSAGNIATVDEIGNVDAVGPGAVTITATSETKTAAAQTQVALTLPVRRFAVARVDRSGSLTAGRNGTMSVGTGVKSSHGGAGDYTVVLSRMARVDSAWRETVMLSKVIENSGGAPGSTGVTYCHLNSYGNTANGQDLTLSVSCYNGAGQKKDGTFEVLVFGNGVIKGRNAFLETTNPGQSHTPAPSKIFNSSGQPMTVVHQSAGNYLVQVNNPRTTAGENYFVTTLGGASATCWIERWNLGTDANYLCDNSTGAPTDALFLMQMIGGGRTGNHWGFAFADNPSPGAGVTYTPQLLYQSSSNSLPITIGGNPDPVLPVGSYLVKFPMFASLSPGYAIQVAASQSPTATCAAGRSRTSGNTLIVQVNCYNRYTGAAAVSYFNIAILE